MTAQSYAVAKARNLWPNNRPLPPSENRIERDFREAVRRQQETEQRIEQSRGGQAFIARIRRIG